MEFPGRWQVPQREKKRREIKKGKNERGLSEANGPGIPSQAVLRKY